MTDAGREGPPPLPSPEHNNIEDAQAGWMEKSLSGLKIVSAALGLGVMEMAGIALIGPTVLIAASEEIIRKRVGPTDDLDIKPGNVTMTVATAYLALMGKLAATVRGEDFNYWDELRKALDDSKNQSDQMPLGTRKREKDED